MRDRASREWRSQAHRIALRRSGPRSLSSTVELPGGCQSRRRLPRHSSAGMAVTTAYDFLQLVEKSRLLSPEQFAEVRTWPERDPQSLAERLVSEGWITPWQSEMLLA